MELDGSRIYVPDFSQLFLEANLARNITQVHLTEQLLYLQAGSIISEPVQIHQNQHWNIARQSWAQQAGNTDQLQVKRQVCGTSCKVPEQMWRVDFMH